MQTSLTCGTLLENSKLPLIKWFQVVYPVTQNKNDRSALSLKRCLGVCCRTAWRLKHKLLEAMAERECGRVLTDVVVFIAAVEVDGNGHPRHVRFDVLPDLKATRCARPCVRR